MDVSVRRSAGPALSGGESTSITLADGRRLSARCWRGTGTPLVLLHGLLDSCEGWASVCSASARPCIGVDLPGFGGSDLPTRPRISAYADDVVALLGALRIETCRLVGHSLGGAVATAVAERASERVGSLVLLAPAGFGRIALAEAISVPGVRNVTELILPLGLRSRFALNLAYKAMVSNGAPPEPDVLERVVSRSGALVPGAREATRAVVAAGLSEHAFYRRRVAYHGPVTAVWGDRDRLVSPRHRHGVQTAFPHATFALWTGMGHHPQRERPAELLTLLDRDGAGDPAAIPAQRRAA
jgi:pyruvate dehydrogenase E2 component (dihydrolipoamide acetyltransferase)